MGFTVLPPPPTISSFNPITGVAGDVVTLTGTNFTTANSIKINGVTASFSIINSTTIEAIVPTGCSSGLIELTTDGGVAIAAAGFTVALTGGGGALGGTRGQVSVTTPTLQPGAIHNTTIPLGKAFLLLAIATNAPAWVRLYTTPVYRSADASRQITQDPINPENGIISEDITTTKLSIDLEGNGLFQGMGCSLESPPKSDIAIAISNQSDLARAITVTYTRIGIEN